MKPIKVSSDAVRDLRQAAGWLELREFGVGDRFAEAFWETAEAIGMNPGLAVRVDLKWRRDESARARAMIGFPSYVLVYREEIDLVRILRVVPAARDWCANGKGSHG